MAGFKLFFQFQVAAFFRLPMQVKETNMNGIPAARHRIEQQQQPQRLNDRQQQQSSGSGEFQPRQQSGGARMNQAGEISYERERNPSRGVG